MSELKLKAKKRDQVGKKVKKIRLEGLIPANVYGKKIKSQALSLDKKEFEEVYSKAGETGIVSLAIDGEKESHSVMLPSVQKDPVSGQFLHVDLRQIILTEKVIVNIPIEMAGESPAAEQKLGILIQNISEVEVEALPLDLPEKFVIDVSKLLAVGDEILVKDIDFDKSKIEMKSDEDQVVVKIEPLAEEEVAPPPAEEPEIAGEDGEAAPGETTEETKEGEEESSSEDKKESETPKE